MKPFTYLKGVNVGGWFAQYDHALDAREHFETFITERDIEQIASWGADHVRVPFECGYDDELIDHYISLCIEWCQKRGLGVLLDLHMIRGQVFDHFQKINPVFLPENTHVIEAVWDRLARRFAPIGDCLRFELFNEAQDNTGYLWSALYPKLVEIIRRHDSQRVIYVGSNKMNSIFALPSLHILNDEHIVYNFHYYDPHPYTHQCAEFDEHMRVFRKPMHYPGDMPGLYELMQQYPKYSVFNGYLLFKHNDAELIRENMDEARKFMQYTGKPLYCGEFGVIDKVDEDDAVGWVRDVVAELRRLNIGYAYWAYKQMDFGLVDEHSQLLCPKLVQTLFA